MLDHGELNIPLAKRGNIDAQLDTYKAQQAAKAKAQRKVAAASHAALKTQAKAALADLVAAEGLLTSKAEKLGTTRANLVAILTDWSKWTPAKAIKTHAEWMSNATGSAA